MFSNGRTLSTILALHVWSSIICTQDGQNVFAYVPSTTTLKMVPSQRMQGGIFSKRFPLRAMPEDGTADDGGDRSNDRRRDDRTTRLPFKNESPASNRQNKKSATKVQDMADAQKERQIQQLMKQKNQRETKINRLKFQLMEFKAAVEDSEKQRLGAEEAAEALREERDEARKEDANLFDGLKAQFSLEKEKLVSKLSSSDEELRKFKLSSQKELEKAKMDAEEEKTQLLGEISALQEALDETTAMINKAKEEMREMASSVADAESQIAKIIEKDEEIVLLVEQRDNMEFEMNAMKGQLDELKIALEESEEETLNMERKMDELKQQSEISRQADKDLMKKMKEEFSKEKDGLTNQLDVFSDELAQVKLKSDKKLKEAVLRAKGEKEELDSQVTALSANLAYATDRIERARKSVLEVKRVERAVKTIAGREKKDFKKKVWDLETKLEAARYTAIKSEKEVKALEAAALSFNDQLKALEETHAEDISDLEQRMIAEEMFYAKSKTDAREKTKGLVLKLQRRMNRREQKAMDLVEAARQELMAQFNIEKKDMTNEQNKVLKTKSEELSSVISDAAEKKRAMEADFEAKVVELNRSMADAIEDANAQMEQLKKEHQKELEEEREKAMLERKKIMNMKDEEIRKIQNEGRRALDTLRMELTAKFDDEKKALKNILSLKNQRIEKYEDDQKSYRKLIGLAWRATKEKVRGRRNPKK